MTVLASGQQPVEMGDPRPILREHAEASVADLDALRSGRVFVKAIHSQNKEEIALAAIARMGVSLDFFLRELRDIASFKQASAVMQIGKFSDPPQETDLSSLTLEPGDIRALPECRPGDCDLKLSAEMMAQLRAVVVTAGSNRRDAVNRLFRTLLFRQLTKYLEEGQAAMITYDDQDEPLRTAERYASLLPGFRWLSGYVPLFWSNLADDSRSPEVENFYYWSKEKVGLKPVVSMTHVMIRKTTIGGRQWAFAASKQIYANHYFEASLGLTVLVPESADPEKPDLWVAYFNRSRSDVLGGWLGGLKRSIVRGRVRASVEKDLAEMKRRLEARYRSRTAATLPG